MMSVSWTANIIELEDGERGLEFPPESVSDLGWKEGDTLIWKDLGNGSWSLSKQEDFDKDKAIKILKNHNLWRRNQDDINPYEMCDPKELGKAIDYVVELLEREDN